jgi:hypothetical protein
MSYYRTIDGKKYDGALLDLAQELVQGQGDGRISVADAEKLFAKVKDGGTYTDVEKDTIEYIRKHHAWTEAADEWFRAEVRRWAATK